jgi:hypothetical protein
LGAFGVGLPTSAAPCHSRANPHLAKITILFYNTKKSQPTAMPDSYPGRSKYVTDGIEPVQGIIKPIIRKIE